MYPTNNSVMRPAKVRKLNGQYGFHRDELDILMLTRSNAPI